MGPLGKFTTPKTYKKKVDEGFVEIEEMLRNAQDRYDAGDADAAVEAYQEALDELDKHIFRENLPLWDITRASLAVALFTIPIAWLGPWWTVAGVGGAITYTIVSTQKIRKESKPRFEKLREEAVKRYNDMVIKEKGKITLPAQNGTEQKARLKKPRKKQDDKRAISVKNP